MRKLLFEHVNMDFFWINKLSLTFNFENIIYLLSFSLYCSVPQNNKSTYFPKKELKIIFFFSSKYI